MSRVRLANALALLGILITTGGCAESATAPEATLRGASIAEARSKPTPADSVANPTSGGSDDGVTLQGGTYMTGGGRSEP